MARRGAEQRKQEQFRGAWSHEEKASMELGGQLVSRQKQTPEQGCFWDLKLCPIVVAVIPAQHETVAAISRQAGTLCVWVSTPSPVEPMCRVHPLLSGSGPTPARSLLRERRRRDRQSVRNHSTSTKARRSRRLVALGREKQGSVCRADVRPVAVQWQGVRPPKWDYFPNVGEIGAVEWRFRDNAYLE